MPPPTSTTRRSTPAAAAVAALQSRHQRDVRGVRGGVEVVADGVDVEADDVEAAAGRAATASAGGHVAPPGCRTAWRAPPMRSDPVTGTRVRVDPQRHLATRRRAPRPRPVEPVQLEHALDVDHVAPASARAASSADALGRAGRNHPSGPSRRTPGGTLAARARASL